LKKPLRGSNLTLSGFDYTMAGLSCHPQFFLNFGQRRLAPGLLFR
jgi:hypothetical protein